MTSTDDTHSSPSAIRIIYGVKDILDCLRIWTQFGQFVIFVTCRTSSLKAKILRPESEILGLTVEGDEDKSNNITNIIVIRP